MIEFLILIGIYMLLNRFVFRLGYDDPPRITTPPVVDPAPQTEEAPTQVKVFRDVPGPARLPK